MRGSSSGAPIRRLAVCIAVIGLAAATSSPARADGGVAEMAVPPLPDAAEVTVAVLEEAGVTELMPPAAADPPVVLPAVPAPTTAAEPVAPGADAVPPPEPVVEAPEEAVTPDSPPPAVAQSRPVNVNVSVRVDSPGDDGAVTQANVAAVAAPAESEAPPQYQPAPPQYQAPIPDEPAGQEPARHVPDSAPAPPEIWDWTWTLGCGDDEVPVPLGADPFVRSWNWKWNWNCETTGGANSNSDEQIGEQYQQPVSQYQPVNINVSIRFNSPGSNGSVVQTNVAVAVAPPVPPVPPAAPVAVAPPIPSAAAVAQLMPAAVSHFALGAAPLSASLSLSASATPEQNASAQQPALSATPVEVCCTALPPSRARADVQVTQSALLRRPPKQRVALLVSARLRPAHLHVVPRSAAAGPGARAALAAQKSVRTLRPAARRAPFDPRREPVLVLGSAVLAPLSAPDRGVGIPILLLLAVGFAFAAASTNVAREARAPTAEPGRRPERPG